jgi:hypothetical protein
MAGNSVWIKNNNSASARVRIKGAPAGEDGIEVPERTLDFPRASADRATGIQRHNGYTRILQSDYDALYEGSKIFKAYIDGKQFVKFDNPPDEALTLDQRIANLETEKSALQAQITDLTNRLAAKPADTGAAVAAIQAKLDAYKAANPESAVAAIQAEFDSYKAANPESAVAAIQAKLDAYKAANPEGGKINDAGAEPAVDADKAPDFNKD